MAVAVTVVSPVRRTSDSGSTPGGTDLRAGVGLGNRWVAIDDATGGQVTGPDPMPTAVIPAGPPDGV